MSKVSQILGITYTIASKCQKYQKCPDGELEEMAEWRWLGGEGVVKSVKVSKVSQILGITTTIASFDTHDGSFKSVKRVKCVQMVRLR